MNQENNHPYGAKIERGVIQRVTEDGFIVLSYDREGLETPQIKTVQNHQYSAGDRVYFFLYDDGSGKIICAMGENEGGNPSGGIDIETVKKLIGEETSKEIKEAIQGIKYPVTSVNKKTGDVELNATDVGARASTWLPSALDLKNIQYASWDGNTTPEGIPGGFTFVMAGNTSEGHGFPVGYATIFALKSTSQRCFQVLVEKEHANMRIRSGISNNEWGEWQEYAEKRDVHPVGSIYISAEPTSPASLFGGTWEQLKDRFLLGAGSSYTAGKTGGAATVTLTTSQIPEHNHTVYSRSVYTGSGNHIALCNESNSTGSYVTGSRGGGEAHNNMPPYLVVYMWKRVS